MTARGAIDVPAGFWDPLDEEPADQSLVSAPTEQDGAFTSGVKDTFDQVPMLLGGGLAALGDAMGSDVIKDYGLGVYEKYGSKIEARAKPDYSFDNVLKGQASTAEFLKYAAGYAAGQIGQAVITGGVGSFLGKAGLKVVAEKIADRAIAKRAATLISEKGLAVDVAKETARKSVAGELGMAAALLTSNAEQEIGSIYPDAVKQAQSEGQKLDNEDLFRIAASGIGAAGFETLSDKFIIGKLFKGGGAGKFTSRLPREVAKGVAVEGGTEGIQTGIERLGAGQPLTDADARKSYIDSMGLGAVGGGGAGSIASLHGETAPAQAESDEQSPLDDPGAQPVPQGDALSSALSNAQAFNETLRGHAEADSLARVQAQANAVGADLSGTTREQMDLERADVGHGPMTDEQWTRVQQNRIGLGPRSKQPLPGAVEQQETEGGMQPVTPMPETTLAADRPSSETVRLFRGETPDSTKGGEWFTTDKAKAEKYGALSYVDVTQKELGTHFAQGHGGPDEFVMASGGLSSRVQPLAEAIDSPAEAAPAPVYPSQFAAAKARKAMADGGDYTIEKIGEKRFELRQKEVSNANEVPDVAGARTGARPDDAGGSERVAGNLEGASQPDANPDAKTPVASVAESASVPRAAAESKPALRSESNGKEKRGVARAVERPDVSTLDERQRSMQESKQSILPQLRGQGDQASRTVADERPAVSGGNRSKTESAAQLGSQGQQRELRAGQHAVGDEERAGAQHAQESPVVVSGENASANGVGGANRTGAVNASVPAQSGRNVGGASANNPVAIWKEGERAQGGGVKASKRPFKVAKKSAWPTVQEIHKLAESKGIAWNDDPEFMARTKRVTGKERLDDLTGPELRKVANDLGKTAKAPASKAEAASTSSAVIADLGEKIGDARKDTADRGFTKGKAPAAQDDRPAWAKRFQVSQIVKAGGQINSPSNEGRWAIRDTRKEDWMGQASQVGRDTFATKEEADAALPLIAVAQKHRVVHQGDGNYEIWRDVSDRKRVKVVDQTFDSRESAMEYMARHAVEIIETNTTFGESDLPTPPDRARTGPERRKGNVVGKQFMDTFGFRGVEFGNWNNQDERQTLMNEAYDGLMDLADVLRVPPKALGLNGDLALAFGARGQGLSSARAHYERDRAVINLTKENGAGSLAHEFFHALDAYLGRQDGKASSEWTVNADGTRTLKSEGREDYATHGFRIRDSGVREELRTAYEKLVTTIFKKATTYVEDATKADDFAGRARDDLETELTSLRKGLAEQKDPTYWKRNNKPASAELLAEFDTIAKRMLDGEAHALATDWRHIESSKAKIASRWTNDNLERLGAIYKEVRGRSGFNAEQTGYVDKLRGYMNRYSARLKMLADAQTGTEKVRMVPTEFVMNAKELDQGRGGDYWTSPHEMAARAFQGYVEDAIAERGGVSRFLNYAPENGGIITPWGVKFPYPRGAERKTINVAIEGFVKTLKTKETDKGTALFSRSDQTDTPEFKRWFGDSKVVDDAGGPIRMYHGTDQDFSSFSPEKIKSRFPYSFGFHFTDRPFEASVYADSVTNAGTSFDPASKFGKPIRQGGNVLPVYIKAEHPLVIETDMAAASMEADSNRAEIIRKLVEARDAGTPYDSVIIRKSGMKATGNEALDWGNLNVIVFKPEQIKSAIGNRGTFDPSDPNILRRAGTSDQDTGHTPDVIRSILTAKLGTRGIKTLENSGVLKIVADASELPAAVQEQMRGDEPGVYFGGVAYLVANRLNEDNAERTLLHEVGEHYGLESMMGDKAYARLLTAVSNAKTVNTPIREAWEAVKLAYPKLQEGERDFVKEVVARIGESAAGRKTGLWQSIVQAVRRFFFKLGLPMRLNEEDIAGLVRKSLGAAMEGKTVAEKTDTQPLFSRPDNIPVSAETLAKAGLAVDNRSPQERIREAADEVYQDFRGPAIDRAREAYLDDLDPVKRMEGKVDASGSGYVALRMAAGSGSTTMAAINLGVPQWQDGIVGKKVGSKGLMEVLTPVRTDLNRFLLWMVGKRAQWLHAQGRENNLSPDQIKELVALGEGRQQRYTNVAADFRAFNTGMLEFLRDSGHLTQEKLDELRKDEFYIPFYRTTEEDDVLAPYMQKGSANQRAPLRKLKGGKLALNDPLQNILLNIHKIVDSSMKNEGARRAAKNIPEMEVIEPLDELSREELDALTPEQREQRRAKQFEWFKAASSRDRSIVRIMDGGQTKFYRVTDPALMRALGAVTAPQAKGALIGFGRLTKRILTQAVTLDPSFMAANFIRDLFHAWSINKDEMKFGIDSLAGLRDSMKGLKNSLNMDADVQAMMFAGASFMHGYSQDAESEAATIRAKLRQAGFDRGYTNSLILTARKGFDLYAEIGTRIENANRLATYRAAMKKGKSRAQALFESKDLMDYSLKGNSAGLGTLMDTVPFLNARIQGLYKLGRALGDNPRNVILRAGLAVTQASLLLWLVNKDKEEYQRLNDYDKDNNWHIFVGETHYRIPKPFEIGILFGTLPERMLQRVTGKDTNQDALNSLKLNLLNTLSFNPIPQAIKPVVEAYVNYDFFRDAPIETLSDKGKIESARYDTRTSHLAVKLGEATGSSPKMLEHLFAGYAGTLGAYAMNVADLIVDKASGTNAPASRIYDYPVIKRFARDTSVEGVRYGKEMYAAVAEIDQIYRTVKEYRREGRFDDAQELLTENAEGLRIRKFLNRQKDQVSDIRNQMERIYNQSDMDPTAKRERLDLLQNRIINVERMAAEAARRADAT